MGISFLFRKSGDGDSALSSTRLLLLAGPAAFITYFSMYAFRKPFSGATYDGVEIWGMSAKVLFVLCQLIGYLLSKYLGIWVCSSVTKKYRRLLLISLITFAEFALILFAVLPDPLKPAAMFLNGLPLGMIWGLVTLYLEGRRLTDLLISILCVSFIFASAVTKDAGRFFLSLDVPVFWMPAVTGLAFVPFLAFGIFLLGKIPEPDSRDEAVRSTRSPMTFKDRLHFFTVFSPVIFLQVVFYFCTTAFRNFREDFGAEIFQSLGMLEVHGVFSRIDVWAGLITLVTVSVINAFNPKKWGVIPNIILMFFGCGILLGSSVLFSRGQLAPIAWLIGTGLGGYMMYIPSDTVFFERVISRYSTGGTATFMAYIMDSAGYTGTVALYLYGEFGNSGGIDAFGIFKALCIFLPIGGSIILSLQLLLFSFYPFTSTGRKRTVEPSPSPTLPRDVLVSEGTN